MALKRQQTQPSSMIQIQKGNYKNVSIVLQHKRATYYYYLVLLFFCPHFLQTKKTRKERTYRMSFDGLLSCPTVTFVDIYL